MGKAGFKPEMALIKKQPRKITRRFLPLIFIGPHLLLFIIFVLIPIVYGLVISFMKWDFINPPVWVGLENYKEILFHTQSTYHRDFLDGLKNTVLFVVLNVPVSILVPLIFALTLSIKPGGSKIFQSILYLPTLFSISAVGIIWMQMLNKRFGLVSWFEIKTAITATYPHVWIALIVMSVWWTMGTNMVIYQAALSGVSKDLYESARLDGAGALNRIWYISLPSIKFQLLYTLVITVAGSFNVYGQPLMLTQQGVGGAPKINVLIMYIKNLAFGSGQSIAGMASAMAIILGAFIVVASLIQFKLVIKDE